MAPIGEDIRQAGIIFSLEPLSIDTELQIIMKHIYNPLFKRYVAGTITLIALLSTTGCATPPSDIGATYVSPYNYTGYSCGKVITRMNGILMQTTDLYKKLKRKSDIDEAQAAGAWFVFLPVGLFLEGGDGSEAEQYSNMKGDYEALRIAAAQKQCNVKALPKDLDAHIIAMESSEKPAK